MGGQEESQTQLSGTLALFSSSTTWRLRAQALEPDHLAENILHHLVAK
jgi:hypothetical protein